MVKCNDGYLFVVGSTDCADVDITRSEMAERLEEEGIKSVSVLSVSEAATHPQTAARELIVQRKSANGVEWPLLGSPLKLSQTPPLVEKPIKSPSSIDDLTAYLLERKQGLEKKSR